MVFGTKMTAVGCLVLAVLVSVSTFATALTEPPRADGYTNKTDSSCNLSLAWPLSQNVIHQDGADVLLSIDAEADDDRTSGYGLHNYFEIHADYQGPHDSSDYIVTNPSDDLFDTFYLTVREVSVNTYMDVTWSVYIWDPITSTTLCHLDNSNDVTRFTFVSA